MLRWIVFAPLIASLASGLQLVLVRRSLRPGLVVTVSCVSVLVSFALSAAAFGRLVGLFEAEGSSAAPVILIDTLYTWVGVGVGSSAFSADLAFRFDSLSAVMCFVVAGVGFLIHLYAVGYMGNDAREDGGIQRFFCYLNLFTAAMLTLVLADNLLLMFLGWEGVGLCSYLLIGFWYSDSENAYAGSKAFIVNRVGDVGFLVGILLLFWALADAGTPAVSFRAIEAGFGAVASHSVSFPAWLGGGSMGLPTAVGLCFFAAAVGKSAQLPLYVWLPDAMRGPTPVSALIHAATMVTAGVYLVVRMSFLYEAAPGALLVIAWTGGATAIFAGLLSTAQNDIKRVLAYSTISQLGYMFMAAGCGAYTVAVFHLVTHAFFKALLFMAAGVVIVAAHHEQDMWRIGGLRKRLPATWWVTLIGVLALSGAPPLSGFFSKDEILTAVYFTHDLPGHFALYQLGLITAGFTAFAMFRMFFVTFHGRTRLPRELRGGLHDPRDLMLWPMYILAALACVGAVLGVPQFWGDRMQIEDSDSLGHFLAPVVAVPAAHEVDSLRVLGLVGLALAVSIAGASLAYVLYVSRPQVAERLAPAFAWLRIALQRKLWVDEVYDVLVVRPLVALSDRVLYRGIDVGLIDRTLVEGSAKSVWGFAQGGLKHLQSGLAQAYLLVVVAGTVALLAYLIG